MIEASELESDRLVQRSFSDLEVEPAAEEEAGPGEAGAELELPVAVEYWELVMAHCAFAGITYTLLYFKSIYLPRTLHATQRGGDYITEPKKLPHCEKSSRCIFLPLVISSSSAGAME